MKNIKEYYSQIQSNDDPNYIYSIRNKIGFYQNFVLKKYFVKIINRNKLSLSNFNNIIDIGCGTGYWLREIANLRGNSKGLVGLDISKERIKAAKSINNNIAYIINDICNMPFNSNLFDFVIAFDVFMFLIDDDDLIKSFSEAVRVLIKNGYFLFFDIIGKKVNNNKTRGFKLNEIIEIAKKNGLKLIDKMFIYKKIFGINKLTTAYLADKIPMEILLFLEKASFFPSNNMFLLFKKE